MRVMAQCDIGNVSYTIANLTGQINVEWKDTLNILSFEMDFFDQLELGPEHVDIFSTPVYYTLSRIWVKRRAALPDI